MSDEEDMSASTIDNGAQPVDASTGQATGTLDEGSKVPDSAADGSADPDGSDDGPKEGGADGAGETDGGDDGTKEEDISAPVVDVPVPIVAPKRQAAPVITDDDEDVSAVVIDNGSGMCKGE